MKPLRILSSKQLTWHRPRQTTNEYFKLWRHREITLGGFWQPFSKMAANKWKIGNDHTLLSSHII